MAKKKYHTVKKGESLHTIALEHYGNMGEYWRLVEDNKLETDSLHEGQKLFIRENEDGLD